MPSANKSLRIAGWFEGLSFLILLFIAMPLKYGMGMPGPVRVVGWAHGVLFVIYILAIVWVAYVASWGFGRIFKSVAAGFLPFGPFVINHQLKEEEAAQTPASNHATDQAS